ncbi:hypothetical protein ABW636_02360 [Aquimarina sp. 2201CG1-2-11]|uniref:hypothetical protein n=1 Tax=Aquimarina discodermiae TaxID=3231043 RepID=UPI003463372D
MNSLLRSLFLLSFFMVMGLGNAQTVTPYDSLHKTNDNLVSHLELDMSEKKVFSYDSNVIQEKDHRVNHDHDKIVLMDVLSSENHSDFNCSGGFCMNRSHFHKKGLSSKRQLFIYFMNITC